MAPRPINLERGVEIQTSSTPLYMRDAMIAAVGLKGHEIVWLIDVHGNEAYVDYFGSVEAALDALASLDDCTSCINCSNMSRSQWCNDCVGCDRCYDCDGCHGCVSMYRSTGCTDCNICTGVHGLQDAHGIIINNNKREAQ